MNTDRITKLVAKIEVIDEKMANLQQEREELVSEAQGLLTGSTPAAKTTKKSAPSVGLGTRILDWLASSTESVDLSTIAKGVKEDTQKVGVSLYHLVKKNLVIEQDGMYYARPANG